ncbi:MAG: type II toxin-antitoxin system VapC family toxin [Acidobacteria bacterium]|nr:type II toxin-antitoxin system VapC family toxin [Acidobacteriota bacterium]
MRLLLDTHVFLWLISGSPEIPPTVLSAVRDPGNQVFLSVASVWEAIVKFQLGKLSLPEPPETYLPAQRERHQVTSLAIEEADLSHLSVLPPIHRDPFDRILIAQALRSNLVFVTVDARIRAYPVTLMVWS